MEISLVEIIEGLLVPLKCKTTGTITATATTNISTDSRTILTKWIIDPYSTRFFRTEERMDCEGSGAKGRTRSSVLFQTSVKRSFALSNVDDEETFTQDKGSWVRKNNDICCSEKQKMKWTSPSNDLFLSSCFSLSELRGWKAWIHFPFSKIHRVTSFHRWVTERQLGHMANVFLKESFIRWNWLTINTIE